MQVRIVNILFAVAILGIILFLFNPENYIWFPKCPFLAITGYRCPGCGLQRAVYQYLHLNFKDAFMLNPSLAISLPYVSILILVTYFVPERRCVWLRRICYHHVTILAYLVLMILWWIFRNVFDL